MKVWILQQKKKRRRKLFATSRLSSSRSLQEGYDPILESVARMRKLSTILAGNPGPL